MDRIRPMKTPADLSHLICVPAAAVAEKAARMPVAYLDDCKATAVVSTDDFWCWHPSDFFKIRVKYQGFARSEVDRHAEGEIISGCCDRADQR